MLTRYVDGWFKMDNDPTIGVEFGSKLIKCKDGTVVRLQVWDTAGQESFRSITKSYYRGAIGAILVYDITQEKSFNSLPRWLEDTLITSRKMITLLVVGNKNDLESARAVSTETGKEFSKKHQLLFLETSAKSGVNIEKAFECITNIILDKIKAGEIDPKTEMGIRQGVGITTKELERNETEPKKGYCCNSS